MKALDKLIDRVKTDIAMDGLVFRRRLTEADSNVLTLILNLIKDGYLKRKDYGKVVGDEIGFAYLPLSETIVEPEVLRLLPQEIAEKYCAIAVYKIGQTVTITCKDPTDQTLLKYLSSAIGLSVSAQFGFEDEIQNAIKLHYATSLGLDVLLEDAVNGKLSSKVISKEELTKLSQAKEIKDLMDMIVYLAIQDRVSDIHIEPKKHHLLLRFRCDGVLFNKAILPLEVYPALVCRIKVLANLDISEKRRPQDGRFDFDLPQFTIDLRVSLLPTLHGEKVVARLLGTDLLDKYLDFQTLGFSPDIIEDISNALNSPNGMLFVTGPTGSGKTTTLHCALNYLNNPGVNIVTIEDPIEYEHPDITQVSVNQKQGRDFPTLLRSVLRQDPDVIMIGEIRDLETAKIAANAAMTGHMVLTSLHTNDAIQAVTRMVEMGVEHFVVAPSIIGVLGQRLVRRLCHQCKEAYTPELDFLEEYFDLEGVEEIPQLHRAVGCNACKNVGYSGRVAIHEYLGVSPELRNSILKGTDYDEFFQIAMNSKMYRPFAVDGIKKVISGLTTIDEIKNSISFTNSKLAG